MDRPGWVGAHATCGHLLRVKVGVRAGAGVGVGVGVRVRVRVRASNGAGVLSMRTSPPAA